MLGQASRSLPEHNYADYLTKSNIKTQARTRFMLLNLDLKMLPGCSRGLGRSPTDVGPDYVYAFTKSTVVVPVSTNKIL